MVTPVAALADPETVAVPVVVKTEPETSTTMAIVHQESHRFCGCGVRTATIQYPGPVFRIPSSTMRYSPTRSGFSLCLFLELGHRQHQLRCRWSYSIQRMVAWSRSLNTLDDYVIGFVLKNFVGLDMTCFAYPHIVFIMQLRKGYQGFSYLYNGDRDDIPKSQFFHHVNCKGYKAIFELLLQHGADIEVRDKKGRTPLHCAKQEAFTTVMLKYGANVFAKDNEGKTPTQGVATFGYRKSAAAMEPFVKCDSRAQFDLDTHRLQQIVNTAKDSLDPTVIANAMDASRRLECRMPIGQYKQFPTAAELEKQISELKSTLDQLPIGKQKLDQSMKLQDLKQRLGREMAARRELNGEIAPTDEVSMERKRKANFGEENLFKAIESGKLEQVVYDLTHGANPNGTNSNGQTLLVAACRKGEEAIAALLLEFGADIDAKDADGQTPLHAAASNGRKAMVTLLLERGADNFIENNQGKTAYKVSRYECFDIFYPFQDFRTRAALNLEIKRLEQTLNTDRTPDYLDVRDAKRKLDRLHALSQCKRFASAATLQKLIAKREGELGKLKTRLASEIAAQQKLSE